MVRIPIAANPSVQPQATPGGLMDPNVPASAFGQGLGEGLMSLGQAAHEIYAREKSLADTVNVEEGNNKLRSRMKELGYGPDGAFLREGKNGVNVTKEFLPKLSEAAWEIEQGMTNEDQRRMFHQSAGRLQSEFEGQLRQHEAKSVEGQMQQVFLDGVTAETNNVSNAVRPDGSIDIQAFNNSVARVSFLAKTEAQRRGLDSEGTGNLVASATTVPVNTALDSMLTKNNPQGARLLFEANRDAMVPEVRIRMEAQIAKDARSLQVNQVVDDVWNQLGPRSDTAAVNLDAMTKEIRTRFANAPDALHLALGTIKDRAQEHDYSVKQREDTTVGNIWGQVLAGKPLGAIRSMPEFKFDLDGTRQVALVGQIEAFRRRNENDPATVVSKYATFLKLTDDPKALVGMSDGQLLAQTPVLGPDLTMKLLTAKREALGDLDKLGKAVITDVPWKDIAGYYGVKVKGALTEDDQSRLGQLRDKAMESIRNEQLATGKILTPDRKEEIVRGLLQKVSTKRSSDWFNHDRYLFEYDDHRQKEEVRLTFMNLAATDAEKTQALDYLTRAGADINASNVQTMVQAIRDQKAKK
jgi:hypothetical protein